MMKEYKTQQQEQSEDVKIYPTDEVSLMTWKAWILGPKDTPYSDAYFELDIVVPDNYPLKPPQVKFVTKIFHPNVHFKTGEICLDLLKDAWSAVYTLTAVCRSIINLLDSPEPDSPLNCDCGNLLRSGDVRGFKSMARMYTLLYTQPPKI
uniref:UBC core domain-containing protein n=1 Tax=Arcella intermedia TaxID=1963864 RepID=A0A6B2LNL0_9EUKA